MCQNATKRKKIWWYSADPMRFVAFYNFIMITFK